MKKILISLLTLIFIISITISVNAASTGSVKIIQNKETVKAGDEFSIVLKAEDSNYLNVVEYSGLTITDESGNVSTDITVKSIDTIGDNWSKMNNEGKTNFVYSGEKTTSQEVCKITFTVGDSIIAGTYTINIEGIKVYSAKDEETDIGKNTVSVKAVVDDTTAGNKDNTTTPSNTSNSGNKSTVSSKSNNTTKKTTKLPQTGIGSASIIIIITLGAIGIASYVSYRKYKNI